MTITLPTLRFYAYHGVLPQERKVGGDYELTLHLQIDNDDAYEALCYDELEGTVNYAEAYELVKQEMESLRSYLSMWLLVWLEHLFEVSVKCVRYRSTSPSALLPFTDLVVVELV